MKLPKRTYSIQRTWPGVKLMRLTITPAQAAAMANLQKHHQRHQPVIGLFAEKAPEKQDREDGRQKERGRAQPAAAERVDLASEAREAPLHQSDTHPGSAWGGAGHLELERRLQIDELVVEQALGERRSVWRCGHDAFSKWLRDMVRSRGSARRSKRLWLVVVGASSRAFALPCSSSSFRSNFSRPARM